MRLSHAWRCDGAGAAGLGDAHLALTRTQGPRDGPPGWTDPLNGDTIMTKILAAFLVLGLAIAAGAPVASAAQPAYQHNGTTFDGGNG